MSPEEKILLVAIILAIALIALYFEIKYIRERNIGKKIIGNRIVKDRAFNILLTTKAVKSKLRQGGYQTFKADYMISKADSAYNIGDYESCIEICDKAKEELMKCKQTRSAMEFGEKSGDETEKIDEEEPEAPPEELRSAAGAGGSLYLQSKFELKAAKSDLEDFKGPEDQRTKAIDLMAEAERLHEAGEYQKSLSKSFRARKILSGESEEVAEAAERKTSEDAETLEMSGASAVKCQYCGEPIGSDDRFCGNCGKTVSEKKCSSCGSDLNKFDRFCRKCGAKN